MGVLLITAHSIYGHVLWLSVEEQKVYIATGNNAQKLHYQQRVY